MTRVLDWTVAIVDIPDGGLRAERAASDAERHDLAGALNLLALDSLAARYQIKRLGGGGYRLHGRVTADVTQSCVVSLEPLTAHLEDDFDVEFWPTVTVAANDEEKRVLDGRDVEAIEHGQIAIGRIVFDTLSGAVDPFPRKPGAAFEWSDGEDEKSGKISPFAALSKLKPKDK
jgi:uncharacterized metal-binding protein YceD (DUF177 family)